MKPNHCVSAILVGGSVAATLDILFAFSLAAFYGATPDRVLHTVASGVFGDPAYSGGIEMASYGLLFHFFLSYLWATVFLVAALRIPRLVSRPWLSVPMLGIIVFLSMRLLVLPLSAYPRPVSFKLLTTTMDLVAHILLFGLPIVIATKNALQRSRFDSPSVSAQSELR